MLDSAGATLTNQIDVNGSDNKFIIRYEDNSEFGRDKLAAGNYFIRVFNSNGGTARSNAYSLTLDIEPDFAVCTLDTECTEVAESCDENVFKCTTSPCTTNNDCARPNPADPSQRNRLICDQGTSVCAACTNDMFDTSTTDDSNGTLETATDVSGMLPLSQTLNTCTGPDNYAFAVTDGQTINARMTFDANQGDFTMILLGPERCVNGQEGDPNCTGGEFRRDRFAASASETGVLEIQDGGNAGLTLTGVVDRPAGTWTLQITGASGVVNNYDLSLSVQ